ncbi:Indoleamine 2,3-dioxygenase [Auriscalpium vulgare]|uniref:Indoleamine 2,3-dioxygenase n=1 Tax=Auriscalpium vulgare TaxID=40419 RepID=A0ACB8S8H9_9AGAM|nr:Indoleamine 2,3-dioxygenase [Auriscalpium vulgare]
MAPSYPIVRPQISTAPNTSSRHQHETVPAAADYSSIFDHGFHKILNGAGPPPEHLEPQYAQWEAALGKACDLPLTIQDASEGAQDWRRSIRDMSIISSITPLKHDFSQLLRARMVLVYLQQFYVHSTPKDTPSSTCPIRIPASLSIPLLLISHALDLPPVVTYADTEYYNFAFPEPTGDSTADPLRLPIRILHTFSGTSDEEHFYSVALRIEAEGARALNKMRDMLRLAAVSVGPTPSSGLTPLLLELAESIKTMGEILQTMRAGCEPPVFYGQVRRWFNGCADGAWLYEVDDSADMRAAVDGSEWLQREAAGDVRARAMAGSSAAQSSIIQALDVFLGIEELTHERSFDNAADAKPGAPQGNFLTSMQKYLPLTHRLFLSSLRDQARGLREHVLGLDDGGAAMRAYNVCVVALREFRTFHVRIATLYIVNQARRAAETTSTESAQEKAKGTGGTELLPFLKGIRDRTNAAELSQ